MSDHAELRVPSGAMRVRIATIRVTRPARVLYRNAATYYAAVVTAAVPASFNITSISGTGVDM